MTIQVQRKLETFFYDSGSGKFDIAISGFSTTVTAFFEWVKVGRVIHLQLNPEFTGTKSGGGLLTTSVAIPTQLWPRLRVDQPMRVQLGAAEQSGAWTIFPTGFITFNRDSYANWGGGTTPHVFAGCATYLAVR